MSLKTRYTEKFRSFEVKVKDYIDGPAKFLLNKTFDIRDGEYKRTLLMQAYIFLIISTLLVVKPTEISLFISTFGVESLPGAFITVAICATIVSLLYTHILSKVSLNRLIHNTLVISVITLVVFGILLKTNFLEKIVIYIFYVWVAIFAVLSSSQFWIMANVIFNPREAKRLFGFIGAGAIAGGIFGGYLTSILVNFLGSENLLFVSAFLLLLGIPIIKNIYKESSLNETKDFKQPSKTLWFFENPLNIILESKHLSYMAGIIGVSVIVAKLVDYQFSAIASYRISDPDSLTSFFGFWFSNFNVISLVIQLFVTRRVVGVFGVGVSLLFLPGAIFFGAALTLIIPSLWTGIFIKLADGSLKQSINKSATELLALPIPSGIKNKAKSFIDIFVDSLATGISGVILLSLVTGFHISLRTISIIIILLILLWLYFVNHVRQEYIKSFKIKINTANKNADKKEPDIHSDSVLGGLNKVLLHGDHKHILYVLHKIKDFPNEKFFEALEKLLNHPSSEIRKNALDNLYFYKTRNLKEKISNMIHDEDQDVKISAFEYLLKHSPENRTHIFVEYLLDKNCRVSGAALVSLARETRNNPELKSIYKLSNRIAEKIENLKIDGDFDQKINKIVILKAIGYGNVAQHYSFIDKAFFDEDTIIVDQAILAAGYTKNHRFVYILTGFLADIKYKKSAISSLLRYGSELSEILNYEVKAGMLPLHIVAYLPQVVEKTDSQKAVDFLFYLSGHNDFVVRLKALKALNNLKTNYPYLHFNTKIIMKRILDEAKIHNDMLSVLYAEMKIDNENELTDKSATDKRNEARKSLIQLLERRLDGNLERIFRLIGLKYLPEDILTVYKGIQSKKPDIRINAIEFLDNLVNSKLKRILTPIFETRMLDSVSAEAIKNMDINIPDEYQCFILLLRGNDIKIKLAVLYLIGLTKDRKYLTILEQYTESENYKISTFARKARELILQSTKLLTIN